MHTLISYVLLVVANMLLVMLDNILLRALLPLPSHSLSLYQGGVGGVRLLHTIAASYNFYYISANSVPALASPSICPNQQKQFIIHTNVYAC